MEECESTENEIQINNGDSKKDIQEESSESSLVSILKLQLKEVCIKKCIIKIFCFYPLVSRPQSTNGERYDAIEKSSMSILWIKNDQDFAQIEDLSKEQENSLEKDLELKMAANVEKLKLEEKLETSYREIRKYQDTLQQSQEQLEGAQEMIEDSQVCNYLLISHRW